MSVVDPVTVAIAVASLNLAATMLGGGIFMGRVTARLDAHDADTARIENGLREMKTLLITAAVDASRLKRAENDIQKIDGIVDGLRRGIGYIKDGDAKTIDRQY